jgi:hypothetical protein
MPFISLQDQGTGVPAQTIQNAAAFLQQQSAARQQQAAALQAQQEQASQFQIDQQQRLAEAQIRQAQQRAIAQDIATRQATQQAEQRTQEAEATKAGGTVQSAIDEAASKAKEAATQAATTAGKSNYEIDEAGAHAAAAAAQAVTLQRANLPHTTTAKVSQPAPGVTQEDTSTSWTDENGTVHPGNQDVKVTARRPTVEDYGYLGLPQKVPTMTGADAGSEAYWIDPVTHAMTRQFFAPPGKGAVTGSTTSGVSTPGVSNKFPGLDPYAPSQSSGAAPSQPGQTAKPVPPPAHISILRSNPSPARQAQFDAIYGSGASQSYLNPATTSTAP